MGTGEFYLLPFVKPSMVKQIVGTEENGNNLSYNETLRRLIDRENIDEYQRNVLVSHQFYLPPHVQADQVERMDIGNPHRGKYRRGFGGNASDL